MSRAFDNLSIQIRYGMTTKEEAIQILRKLGPQVPKSDIKAFCNFLRKEPNWFGKLVKITETWIFGQKLAMNGALMTF